MEHLGGKAHLDPYLTLPAKKKVTCNNRSGIYSDVKDKTIMLWEGNRENLQDLVAGKDFLNMEQ